MANLVVMGNRLEFEWFGRRDTAGETLVLLHEGLGSISMWGDFPTRLSEAVGLPVFAYSRQGYGASDSLSENFGVDYMHHQAFDVLPMMLNGAEIKRPILLGHSDGASIALLYVSGVRTHRCSAIIVEAPHVFVEDRSIAGIEGARTAYCEGRLKMALEKYHGANTDRVFWAWNDIWLDPAFRSWNIEHHLSSVAVPVQVIQGYDDEYGTLAQVEAIANQCAGPVEKVLLADCGHSPHRTQTNVVIDSVKRFVSSVVSR